jgi:hypothetical protein
VTKVVLNVPVEAVPDLIRKAVDSVPHAHLIEVLADEALVGRRTNFATMSEATRFSFHRLGGASTEVRAEATNGGVVGFVRQPGVVADVGKSVMDRMVQLSGF